VARFDQEATVQVLNKHGVLYVVSQSCSVSHTKLAAHTRQVGFHGLVRHEQFGRNLTNRELRVTDESSSGAGCFDLLGGEFGAADQEQH
jgi:hypothetical protein